MLDYLKRGHWIDKQTRMMSITIQARSNNGQVHRPHARQGEGPR